VIGWSQPSFMEAQVGGFDITMSGDGEILCLEWVRGYLILWNFASIKKICWKKLQSYLIVILNVGKIYF
jgi:hypothetical protein